MLNEASELALVIMLGYVALCLSVCWAVKLTHLFFHLARSWILRLRRRNLYFEFNDDALVDWENRAAPAAGQQHAYAHQT